jgi:hypothetical protein
VVEATPAVALILFTSGRPFEVAPALLLAVPFALLVANALGAWTAALARSLAEAALFSSVLSLLLLHAAGTFRTPAPGSLAGTLEAVSPFRTLHEAFLGATGSASPDLGRWLVPMAVGAAVLLGTGALGPLLLQRLRATRDT